MSSKLARPVAVCAALTIPALLFRLSGVHVAAVPGLLVFGTAVVAASFLLAWAAEAARVDISGALAIAILAVIAVLPEYAVDLYFAYTAGHDPGYVQYAAANMTGSNRLLLGLGWPVVVLIALRVASRRSGRRARELVLGSGYRVELGFLLIASIAALAVPLSGQISLVLGVALLGFFIFYLCKASRAGTSEPDLAGTAARIGGLPARHRRLLVAGLFGFAAAVIVASAEPFANSLITTGADLGIDRFLLVQWVAPLASEAPEFIVAILFAVHGRGSDAIATLISSKVNQWTLLVGSLPLAYLAGGGPTALVLDARQIEEFLLTAAQTLLGVAALLALRFPRWLALTLLGLFAVQYALPGQAARYLLCAIYGAIAAAALARNRRHILPTLLAPVRRAPRTPAGQAALAPASPPPRPSARGTHARAGQRARGRAITARSSQRQTPRAEQTSEQIPARRPGERWGATLRPGWRAARNGPHPDTGHPPGRNAEESASPAEGRRSAARQPGEDRGSRCSCQAAVPAGGDAGPAGGYDR